MGSVEEPARWHRDQDPWGHWHRGPFGHPRRRPPWLWRRGNGGPLRRDPAERLAGGVAAGVAAWRGLNVTTVRVVFVLVALIPSGFFVPLYVVGWLLIPAAGEDSSIGSRARSDSRGIALAAGLASLLAFLLFLIGTFNLGWINGYAWPQVVIEGIGRRRDDGGCGKAGGSQLAKKGVAFVAGVADLSEQARIE